MAFVVTDVEVVVILAIALIAVYLIGSYWKHRTLTRLAHWFEERFGKIARVQFSSHGHAGLRIRCEMKDRTTGYRELFFSIGLGARENLMYYPLKNVMDNRDRVSCWGVVDKPIKSNFVIARAEDKKKLSEIEGRANMNRINEKELENMGFAVYSSNGNYASKFISEASMPSNLAKFGEVELVELDMLSSTVKTVSMLKSEKLGELMDFVFLLGRAA
ncbi:MAG TPA: hypothetical protein VGR53_08395 [Nitrososphaerales archaeon]|nr:hypothetical protein [Nitrososphaerales archaeon]